jgi:diguanylate cyclase (GGDEF)-like protein/PAS domain S-box-containing protein
MDAAAAPQADRPPEAGAPPGGGLGPLAEAEPDTRATQVFLALPDAVLVLDPSGGIVDCNPAAEERFARPRAALLGGSAERLGVPVEEVLGLDRGDSWSGDIVLPDGVGAGTVVPVVDRSGTRTGFVAVTRDVTRERATAAGLARAEQLWRSMLDVAPTGLALVTLEGRFARVNRALCRIVGYPPEQLTTMTFQQITHPDDLAGDLAHVDRLLSGEISHYSMEKRYYHALGAVVWIQLSAALIHEPGTGHPEQFVVSIEDITERRLYGDRLAAIISGASDAFVGISVEGAVTEWNTAAENLFGWDRTEAMGRPLDQLIIPAAQQEEHRAGLDRLRRGGAGRILNRPVELTARTRGGREVPVELTVWRADGSPGGGEPVKSEMYSGEVDLDSGEPRTGEFYAFIRDTTDRTRAARRQRTIADAQMAIAAVELSPQKVMQEICVRAQALTGADAACLEVVEGPEMVYQAATGAAEDSLGLRVRIDASLSGLAVATGETLICRDSETDPRVNAEVARRTGARSLVVVPLRRGRKVHGVIKVYSVRPDRFDEDDSSTLNLLAAPFGAALANAWRLEESAAEAVTDPLTHLGNRTHALRELDRALLRQRRRGEGHTAVMFLDLDRFKQVNDTLGHGAGDEVLTAVAEKLRLTLRGTDTCARYGGDEFLVICEGVASANDITVLAQRLISLISGPYPIDAGAIGAFSGGGGADTDPVAEIGVSIGIAVSAGASSMELLQAADEAMYEAKHGGGDRYAVRRL